MATYVKRSMTRPLTVEPKPLCDKDSLFDADGFALPVGDGEPRSWDPLWGGDCTACGSPC